jgi:isopentenyl-diphosphate Delta-isomerase
MFSRYWTNTCCSHPIYNEEMETKGVEGAKIAAIRKLEHELGIPKSHFKTNEFQFLTKILYQSKYDETWGEFELDYIFILKHSKNFHYNINPEEVKDVQYVNQQKLKEILKNENLLKTPWFRMIANHFLFEWWNNLENLEAFKNNEIFKLK